MGKQNVKENWFLKSKGEKSIFEIERTKVAFLKSKGQK